MSEENGVFELGAEVTEEEIALFEEQADEISALPEVRYFAEEAKAATEEVQRANEEQEVDLESLMFWPEELSPLEQVASSGYRVVDLRGRFCPADGNWTPHTAKSWGVVEHYNGGPTPERAWKDPVAWIKFLCDLHAQVGRFSPGWYFNGLAYHEVTVFGVVYWVRNWRSKLPHCGNTQRNADTVANHTPIGGSQQAAQSTLRTRTLRNNAHLASMRVGRSRCVGHQEVGSSLCPGTMMADFVRPYRAGQNPGGGGSPPPQQPAPNRRTRYQFCQDNSGAPGTLTWNGKDTWRVTRVQHPAGYPRVPRVDRGDWCRDNSAPVPRILTWQGRDGWLVCPVR